MEITSSFEDGLRIDLKIRTDLTDEEIQKLLPLKLNGLSEEIVSQLQDARKEEVV